MNPIIWMAIMELAVTLIREWIENCPDDEDPKRVLRSPNDRHKRRFEAMLKRRATLPKFLGGVMTRKEWRENEEEILSNLYTYGSQAPDHEIEEICDV